MSYRKPVRRVFAWLTEPGRNVSPEIAGRMLSLFFGDLTPVLGAAISCGCVDFLMYSRHRTWIFLACLVAEIALSTFRLHAICRLRRSVARGVAHGTDVVFATGLVWSALQGLVVFLVLRSDDMLMIVLCSASAIAIAAGLSARNFPAPRFAIAQLLLLDVPYKIGIILLGGEVGWLMLVQGVLFTSINLRIIRQMNGLTIGALRSEFESRDRAGRDPLTGLLNRRGLETTLGLNVVTGSTVLFYLDLDGFKGVNDTHGHPTGDSLLVAVANRLREASRREDLVCRMGGDEFVIVAHLSGAESAAQYGRRIVALLSQAYDLSDITLTCIGASAGAVCVDDTAISLAALVSKADLALYRAKTDGKGRCYVYDPRIDGAAEPDSYADAQFAA